MPKKKKKKKPLRGVVLASSKFAVLYARAPASSSGGGQTGGSGVPIKCAATVPAVSDLVSSDLGSVSSDLSLVMASGAVPNPEPSLVASSLVSAVDGSASGVETSVLSEASRAIPSLAQSTVSETDLGIAPRAERVSEIVSMAVLTDPVRVVESFSSGKIIVEPGVALVQKGTDDSWVDFVRELLLLLIIVFLQNPNFLFHSFFVSSIFACCNLIQSYPSME
ncbi:predicted protein [Arabidopsis lyrata subsp. lyrata]|uniref:Predicted protein n=1 Tax=Arabidopsis lyrata subsp. lyrata TaxID=81972 RepID=D7MJ29_ARALL|nr:predicted protein [Arabidopsis lyrata subsp. lyrata]